MNKQELMFLLRKYKIHPRREQGQNFLINQAVINKIITTADLQPQDIVLEIGPGLGAITVELCKKAKKVIAVEQDRNFIPILQQLVKMNKNLLVINNDIFKWPLKREVEHLKYKLVSNLPFNITSLVLRNFLEFTPKPSQIVVLVQKEIAERACAQPGKMSILSVAVQFFGEPEIIEIIKKNNFYPQPEVDAAILKIKIYAEEQLYLRKVRFKAFFQLIHHGYAARRKKLSNNLSSGYQISKKEVEKLLNKAGLSIKCRAQDLSIEQWLRVFDAFFQI